MKKFIIYASMQNPDEIQSVIQDAFKDKKAVLSASDFGMNIVLKRLLAKDVIDIDIIPKSEWSKRFAKEINIVSNMFSSEKYEDDAAIELVLTQLQFINIILEISVKSDFSNDALSVFKAVNSKLSGMALLEDGSLLNNKNEPVYSSEGKKLRADFNVFAAENTIDLPKGGESEESSKRKANSISILKSLDIPVLEGLPTIPDSANTTLRSKDEICERAAALLLIIQYACDVAQGDDLKKAKDIVISILKKYEVLDCLTPIEQQFLYTDTPDVQQAIRITWQYEAYWVLIWALGYIDDLDNPNKTCDCDIAINALSQFDFYDDFYDAAKIRPVTEILDSADFTYRLDWACVDARLKKAQLPNDINYSVTKERHRAFNWLMNYKNADWDYVTMDT